MKCSGAQLATPQPNPNVITGALVGGAPQHCSGNEGLPTSVCITHAGVAADHLVSHGQTCCWWWTSKAMAARIIHLRHLHCCQIESWFMHSTDAGECGYLQVPGGTTPTTTIARTTATMSLP